MPSGAWGRSAAAASDAGLPSASTTVPNRLSIGRIFIAVGSAASTSQISSHQSARARADLDRVERAMPIDDGEAGPGPCSER